MRVWDQRRRIARLWIALALASMLVAPAMGCRRQAAAPPATSSGATYYAGPKAPKATSPTGGVR